jgi:hypothetical protein
VFSSRRFFAVFWLVVMAVSSTAPLLVDVLERKGGRGKRKMPAQPTRSRLDSRRSPLRFLSPLLASLSLPRTMVVPQVLRSAISLSPSARSLASGVPAARAINLAASAGQSSHGHGHGSSGPRSDSQAIPKWVARVEVGPFGVTQRSKQNGRLRSNPPSNPKRGEELTPLRLCSSRWGVRRGIED